MTKIQWTGRTWNPIAGCDIVSPGCRNCYAMRDAHRLAHNPNPKVAAKYAGTTKLVKGKPVWTGRVNVADDDTLLLPLRTRKPTTWFVNSMSDLFHGNVPDEVIDRIFAVMALCPHHTFQVLTKRSARMREYLRNKGIPSRIAEIIRDVGYAGGVSDIHVEACADSVCYEGETGEWPLINVWLGVSAEDQTRADERIPDLLATPAAIRFVSAEPLLGQMDLRRWLPATGGASLASSRSTSASATPCLDWIIVGGESKAGSRPMHPDWARSIRDQCASAGVPLFFKQWGDWLPWAPEHGPSWKAQNGDSEDGLALFPDDMDKDRKWDSGLWAIPEELEHFAFQKVGTKKAGRLLDGVEHNGMPESAAPIPMPRDLASGEIG
ncbi:DUF5131 family protein [Hoeflea sp.]|uniref:DUF5131 family protein n=1 Tax=Hoeflea sp. TaxID=1940281 RepID=UPI003B52B622